MQRLRRMLNPERRLVRWIRKSTLLLLLLLLVLYPNPALLVRNIDHWVHLNQLPDPHAPALDAFAADLAPHLHDVESDARALQIVEWYVLEALPYAWDWDTWGVADYVPTVDEAVARGQEDCDGQAVVAAALLRRFGYEAHLKTDGAHVWVWTPGGETMSPSVTTSGRSLVSADEGGSHVDFSAILHPGALLVDWPTALAYGLHVFPLWRELVIVIGLWLCLVSTEASRRRDVLCAAGLVLALLGLRAAGGIDDRIQGALVAWLSFGCMAATIWLAGRRRLRLPSSGMPTPRQA